jgi:hypothetical protein
VESGGKRKIWEFLRRLVLYGTCWSVWGGVTEEYYEGLGEVFKSY